jgi:predicted dehydrogenase/aryl-alcohol dehydrogenase-like predicted oxidoreductase
MSAPTNSRDYSSDRLRWGIIGGGNISKQFAASVATSETGRLVAFGTRSAAQPVPEQFGTARNYVGYQTLLDDPGIEAVYIGLPHPFHAEWSIKAAQAGKHVLCEKPIAMNVAETFAIFDAAEQAGVMVIEGYMYRSQKQTRTVLDLIAAGRIGEVRYIQAAFGYRKAFDPEGRHFKNELGGGGIMDVGCYPVSFARLIAGAALGKPWADPVTLHAVGKIGEARTDDEATALMQFDNGITAVALTSTRLAQGHGARIVGTEGTIEIAAPWFCQGKNGGSSTITLTPSGGEKETIEIADGRWLFAVEADMFAASLAAGKVQWPAPDKGDTLGNMRTLDRWRQAIGLIYDVEQPSGRTAPLSGRPLSRPTNSQMPMTTLPGIDKPISRLGLGSVGPTTYGDAAVLYDAFYEAGGTLIDTARGYRKGGAETFLGHWLKNRGVREDMVIITKGAHTPNTRPDAVGPELDKSLEALQTDYVDLYFLHRDDTKVPVSEWVDVLDGEYRAGRIRTFGGSNWSLARFDEANDYARRTGKQGFLALSNHFSLADMLDPVWSGTIAVSDDESVAWFTERQAPNFAWSSQARGFFTDRAGRDRLGDQDLVRSWYNEENFARRERAEQLAREKGVHLLHITLAYTLAQAFPVFPLIGPMTLPELRDSLKAANVTITPEEARWLRTGRRE